MKRIIKKISCFNYLPLFSLLLALLLGAVMIFLTGNNPIVIYQKMLAGIAGSRNSIIQTLLQTTPLIFCGLAVAVGMRGGLLNLGVEGQLYIGSLCSAIVGLNVKGLPAALHILLCLLAAMAGGALWALIPVIMKLKLGAHEVVSALMLNYIATLLVDFMTNYPLRDADASTAQTKELAASAQLPKLIARSQVSVAIVIGIVLAVLLAVFFKHTVLGYKITMVGSSPSASAAAGIRVQRTMLFTMMISGVCGGLAGAAQVMGTYGKLIQGFSTGYGFEGIAVAVLGTSPVTVIFGSVLFGALRAGGTALSYGTNLSIKFISALQGVIILLMAAPELTKNLARAEFFVRMRRKTHGG